VRTSGGELVEARNRVTELEANQVADGLSLKACGQLGVVSTRLRVSLISCAGESMKRLADSLSTQKQESIQGLAHAADNLAMANTRYGLLGDVSTPFEGLTHSLV
jgi:hypothetical protein